MAEFFGVPDPAFWFIVGIFCGGLLSIGICYAMIDGGKDD